MSEIDPEAVRHELRALMTQMNQVELERVRWRIKLEGTIGCMVKGEGKLRQGEK